VNATRYFLSLPRRPRPRGLVAAGLALSLAAALCPLPIRAAEPVAGRFVSAPEAQYVLAAWTTEQGLPVGDIRGMAQDADGFLWLGMNSGLVRFDGFEFVPWGSRGEPPLPDRFVRTITNDANVALWLSIAGAPGLARIHRGEMTRYLEQDGLPPGPITVILSRASGELWAGGRDGLSVFRDSRWQRLDADGGLPRAELYSLYEDSSRGLWAGSADGVFRRPEGAAAFSRVETDLSFVRSFGEDAAGTLWAADSQQVVRTVLGSVRAERTDDVRLPASGWQLRRSGRGEVWIAALGGGLLRVRRASSGGRAILERVAYENVIAGSPQTVFQDRLGNIWVGIRGGGLLRLSEAAVRTDTQLTGLTNDGIRAMTVDQRGDVWVATGHNINVFSGGGRRTALDISQTTGLHTDVHGRVWAAAHGGLGQVVNGRLQPLTLSRRFRVESVTSLTSDTNGDLWLCTGDDGLVHVTASGVVRVENGPDMTDRPCNVVYGDSHGRVWAGFNNRGGVSVYENGRFTSYADKDGLASGSVMAIYQDQRRAVWISTTGGLSRFDSGRFTTLSARNGLPGSLVPSIIEDAGGAFWVGVNSGAGLVRFPHTEADRVAEEPAHPVEYTLYDYSDGLGGSIHWWSRPGAVHDASGKLWFATGSGLAVVDPRQLPSQPRSATPRIEQVTVDGVPRRALDSLVFAPDSSNVQIGYSALGLSGASKFRFRYRLEGLSTDWVEAGTRRVASYSNLPPGQYRFRVSATTGGGWTEAPTALAFTVRAPFYQTAPFYAGCALVMALLTWAYWWSRHRAARRQFALVLDERTRMSREIHDTLLQDLGAIGLELDVLASRVDPSQSRLRDGLQTLRSQVARCLREARHSIGELRAPRLDAQGLVTGFEGLARDAQTRTSATVTVAVEGEPRRCSQEVEEQLLRIGQEALNNSLRHGQAQHIQVLIRYLGNEVSVRVSDDGVGFVADSHHREAGHWGLVNMSERAASIRARFAIDSRAGSGTMVEAVAPVSR
jgi:signal transduction histidine kinase/ligand-binding sensor domain-containing protein